MELFDIVILSYGLALFVALPLGAELVSRVRRWWRHRVVGSMLRDYVTADVLDFHERRRWQAGVDGVSWRWPVKK